MKVEPPPYPEYREQPAFATREYRVVFWEHQLPPEGSGTPPEQMGWAELTVDLSSVEDVHEAIAWAEGNIDKQLDDAWAEGNKLLNDVGDESFTHGERIYVLYARVPGEELLGLFQQEGQVPGGALFLQIAGWDPTAAPEAPEAMNLGRRRPLRSS